MYISGCTSKDVQPRCNDSTQLSSSDAARRLAVFASADNTPSRALLHSSLLTRPSLTNVKSKQKIDSEDQDQQNQPQMPPAGLSSGIAPGLGPKVVSHQLRGIPPRRQRRRSKPGAGAHVVQLPGAPHGPLPLARSKARLPTRRDTTYALSCPARQRHTSSPWSSWFMPLACPFPRGLTGNHRLWRIKTH
jgi:hypothetical protein